MKYCIKCGKELPDDAMFCSGCGATVTTEQTKDTRNEKTVYDGQLYKCPN